MPVLAVPAAGAIIIALMALLLLMAWQQIANAINQLMPSWHIPGLGSIRDWIGSHLEDAGNAVGAAAMQYIRPYVQLLTVPVTLAKYWITELAQNLRAVYSLGYNIIHVTFPRYLSAARTFTVQLYHQAQAYALALQQAALTYAHQVYLEVMSYAVIHLAALDSKLVSLVASARAYALGLEQVALTYAHQVYLEVMSYAVAHLAALEAKLTAELSVLRGDTVALYRQAQAALITQVAAVKAWTTAAIRAESVALVDGLNSALVTDLEQPFAQVIELTDGLEKVAAGAFTDVLADLRGITRVKPRDLATAAAATLALSVPLLKLARDCTVPNCRNLSQVGRDLQELFTLVEGGALLALLAEVAADPEAAADEVENTLVSPMESLAHEFASLIGVG